MWTHILLWYVFRATKLESKYEVITIPKGIPGPVGLGLGLAI